MNRPLLSFSVAASVAAAMLAVLYIRLSHAKDLADLRLADTSTRVDKLTADLGAATTQNTALQEKVTVLAFDLGAARTKLTDSETRGDRLDHDLTAAKNLLSLQEQNTRALAAEVASLKSDLAEARASNASPEAIAAYRGTIAGLERQLASARNGAAVPGTAGAATAVFTSRVGRSTVLSVGPESAFVVVDFGTNRGARLGQKLGVSRGTETVATVLISDARANFSIAQVQPDTLHGALQKGDSALLIR